MIEWSLPDSCKLYYNCIFFEVGGGFCPPIPINFGIKKESKNFYNIFFYLKGGGGGVKISLGR